MQDNKYLGRCACAAVVSGAGDEELTAAELVALLVREERQREDLPRSSGISIVISCVSNA